MHYKINLEFTKDLLQNSDEAVAARVIEQQKERAIGKELGPIVSLKRRETETKAIYEGEFFVLTSDQVEHISAMLSLVPSVKQGVMREILKM